MKLYDAHTHLNSEKLYPEYQKYIQNFVDMGGAALVNSGASDFYNEKGLEIAKNEPIAKCSLGLHPEIVNMEKLSMSDIEAKIINLKEMIVENREYVVAVGECGIDLHFTQDDLDIQKELFRGQCELARELDLPLVIHSRDAFEETLAILKEYTDLVVYFHCRGYGPREVSVLLDFGFEKVYIGFCGNVTYKKADNLRDSLKIVPRDCLLLETDAPYLAPQVVRGTQNEPMNVKYIYEFVVEQWAVNIKKLAQQCERNFKKLYRL